MRSPTPKVRGSDVRITRTRIRAFARQIAQRFRPRAIILFGSQAWGRPTPDSDVDLFIILPTRRDPAYVAAEIRFALRPPFPVDLVVRSPREVEERLSEGDGFIRDVMERGEILYEAGRARVG